MSTNLNRRTVVLGQQAKFARDGGTETILTVEHTVGVSYVPLIASSLFLPIGNIEKFSLAPKSSAIKVRGPGPGSTGYKYGLRKTLVTANDMTINLTLGDISEPLLQAAFLLDDEPEAGGSAVVPLGLAGPVTGWLAMKIGDQSNTELVEQIVRVEFNAPNLTGAENEHVVNLSMNVVPNALNTFKLMSGFTADAY